MADLNSAQGAVTSNKVGKPLIGVPIDSRKKRNLKKGKK
tara:strand:- start:2212 stop:2328 length:117 start_codon:yes stop_codon:yes gene_type:complete